MGDNQRRRSDAAAGTATSRRGARRSDGQEYIYGSAVQSARIAAAPETRGADAIRELETRPRRQISHETRKNRDKARHMNLGYVAFLMTALVLAGGILIHYIQLQAQVTDTIGNISRLERELNSLRLANDEEYSRITSSVDLEEIKRVAIGELGMVYAQEGQIETYTNTGNDYMRQVSGQGE